MEENKEKLTPQDAETAIKVLDYLRDDLEERAKAAGAAAGAFSDILESMELARNYIDIKAHGTFLQQARAGVDELLQELEEKARKAKQ